MRKYWTRAKILLAVAIACFVVLVFSGEGWLINVQAHLQTWEFIGFAAFAGSFWP